MYEIDFAAYALSFSATSFDDFGVGGIDGSGAPAGDPGGGWALPDGSRLTVISNVGIDEHGQQVFEPVTMIHLADTRGYINYLDWKAAQDHTDPALLGLPVWEVGSTLHKDGFTLEVARTISIVNGAEVAKSTVFIKEDGGVGFMSLNDWEAKQNALENEKKLSGTDSK